MKIYLVLVSQGNGFKKIFKTILCTDFTCKVMRAFGGDLYAFENLVETSEDFEELFQSADKVKAIYDVATKLNPEFALNYYMCVHNFVEFDFSHLK